MENRKRLAARIERNLVFLLLKVEMEHYLEQIFVPLKIEDIKQYTSVVSIETHS